MRSTHRLLTMQVSFLLLLSLEPRVMQCATLEATSGHKPHTTGSDYQSNAIPRGGEATDITSDAEAKTAMENEHKLMLECQHSDYRTYIKCLKREKRQGGLGNARACVDECIEMNCNTSACLRDCHNHCRKRITETHTKMVETILDCQDGVCRETHGPNITNNIYINNIMPNATNCTSSSTPGSTGPPGLPGTTTTLGTTGAPGSSDTDKISITNVINNQGQGSDCNCPGCCNPYYPPWQALPQITIGFGGGGGPIGGCGYPMAWPCMQRYPQQQQLPVSDCGMCGNPFLRYRCDPVCYQTGRNSTQTGSTTTTTQKPNSWFQSKRSQS